MPIYISLVNYTEAGLRDIKKSPARLDDARRQAKELGGNIDKVYLTMGSYDLVTIAEFPDDATAATFALRIGAQGTARTSTMKAFPEDAFREIVKAI